MTRPAHDGSSPGSSTRWWGNAYLAVFIALFILFTLNVLLGKAGIQFGWDLPFLLDDVPEFLLLLVAAVFLMLAALQREREQSGNNT